MSPPITRVFSNSAYFPNNKMGAFFFVCVFCLVVVGGVFGCGVVSF